MQLRTQFSYKMLIEDLHALGYCSAYPEMVKFEKNAAIMTNMVLDLQDNKVADNADHDTCTLDIKGTFLCMAFIAAVTPCLQKKKNLRSKKTSTPPTWLYSIHRQSKQDIRINSHRDF